MSDEVMMSLTVEYDCECEADACEHAITALRNGMQKAYDKGVEDGIRKAMAEVRNGLKQAMRQDRGMPTTKKPKKVFTN